MEIKIVYGTGEGLTELSAFDDALYNAGIANYNLIKLSSVIPKNSKITVKKINLNKKEIGYRLYVVLSKRIETRKGKEAWAGLGWTNSPKGGLFVEHGGSSKKEVKELINKSFKSVKKNRKIGKINININIKTIGIKCKNNRKPICALVCAVYKSKGW